MITNWKYQRVSIAGSIKGVTDCYPFVSLIYDTMRWGISTTLTAYAILHSPVYCILEPLTTGNLKCTTWFYTLSLVKTVRSKSGLYLYSKASEEPTVSMHSYPENKAKERSQWLSLLSYLIVKTCSFSALKQPRYLSPVELSANLRSRTGCLWG